MLAPVIPIDPTRNLAADAGKTSTDDAYRRHEFQTWQGWYEWSNGWTPPEARLAVLYQLRGWPYLTASVARHMMRFSPVKGARGQRTAPPLRTTWRQEPSSPRAPVRFGAEDLQVVWREQFRPVYEEKLWDVACIGASLVHVHWVPDVKAGVERPVLKRWPHEAMFWRGASPAWPGGWYAITADSGLVRIVANDSHWFWLAHGERWHESGAVLSLAETFVSGILAARDEMGLSEAAGRASPWAELPDGVPVNGDPKDTKAKIGEAVQKMVAELGRARTGAVVPYGTKINGFQITSDTQFFERYRTALAWRVGYSLLGQIATMVPGAGGVYTAIPTFGTVAEALVDGDHEATCRGWDLGLARPYHEINAIPGETHLVGTRYVDADAKAKSKALRSTLFANTIAAWRTAGLQPTQADVDTLATECSTPTIALGAPPAPPAGGAPPLPSVAEKVVGTEERAEEKATPQVREAAGLVALGVAPGHAALLTTPGAP